MRFQLTPPTACMDYFGPLAVRRSMRHAVSLLLVSVGLALLGVAFDRTQVTDWVRGYTVRVTNQRAGPRPVAAASAAVLFQWEWTAAAGNPKAIDSGWQLVAMADGASFPIEVKCGGKYS